MSAAASLDSFGAAAAPPPPAVVVRVRSVGGASLVGAVMVAKIEERWVDLVGTAAAATGVRCLDTVVLCVAGVVALLLDGTEESFESTVGTYGVDVCPLSWLSMFLLPPLLALFGSLLMK